MKKITLFVLIALGLANQVKSQCAISSAPTNDCSYGDQINSFALAGVASTGNSGCGSSGYNLFTSPVRTLQLGSTYTWSATVGSGYYNEGVGIWIDLNGDGFYATTEFVASSASAQTHNGTLTIPATATVGTVRMRVRCAYSSAVTSGQACTNSIGFGYGETEDYNVTLICPASAPALTVTGASSAVCSGNTATLTASGLSTYTWSGGITNGASFTASSTSQFTVNGSFGATCPTLTNSAVVTLTVNPSPTITGVSDGSICPGVSYVLTPSGASTYSYISGTSTLSGASVSLAPIVTTTYNVRGTGANGCVSPLATSPTITVTTLASPTLVVSASPASVCPGISSTLSVSGANTYTWNGSTTGATLNVNPTATTIYTVSGTGTTVCNGVKTITVTTYPTPVITVNNGTICSGYNFTMTAGGASSYTFSSASGTVANVVSPAASTSYSVVGTSSLGCLSSASAAAISSVTVRPSPTIAALSGSVCLGLNFSLSPTGANATYSVNGVSTATTQGIVSPAVNTTYSVTGTNTNGCVSPTAALASVSVVANPTVTAVASTSAICVSQGTAVLTASGANTYTWDTSSNNSTIAVSPSVTSVYTVTGTSTLLCSSAQTVMVLVNPLPVMNVTATKTFICLGDNTTISANGANVYLWNTSGTTSSINVAPTASTTYTCVGTSTAGCTTTVTSAITVNSIVLSVSPSSSVCLGKSIVLTAGGAATYTWNGTHLFASFPVTPTSASVYTINATDMNGCAHSKTVSVGVNQLPNVSTTISSTLICTGESATITAGGATSYQWSNGASSSSIVVSPTINIMQTYVVTGTDNNSCTATATRTLGVSLCTGVDQIGLEKSQLSIYPNPNNGDFVIRHHSALTIKLFNGLGQLVKVVELDAANNFTAQISGLAQGVYFVDSGNRGTDFNQKIIVTR